MRVLSKLDEQNELRCPNGHESIRSINWYQGKTKIQDRVSKNLPALKCKGYNVCIKYNGKVAVRPCNRSNDEKIYPVYVMKPGTNQPNFIISHFKVGKGLNERGNDLLKENLL